MGKLRKSSKGMVSFFCPGCGFNHTIAVGDGNGPRWGWNGDNDSPTFTPSILVSWSEANSKAEGSENLGGIKNMVCHSFINDGYIKYLSDCTHNLSGKTVEMKSIGE